MNAWLQPVVFAMQFCFHVCFCFCLAWGRLARKAHPFAHLRSLYYYNYSMFYSIHCSGPLPKPYLSGIAFHHHPRWTNTFMKFSFHRSLHCLSFLTLCSPKIIVVSYFIIHRSSSCTTQEKETNSTSSWVTYQPTLSPLSVRSAPSTRPRPTCAIFPKRGSAYVGATKSNVNHVAGMVVIATSPAAVGFFTNAAAVWTSVVSSLSHAACSFVARTGTMSTSSAILTSCLLTKQMVYWLAFRARGRNQHASALLSNSDSDVLVLVQRTAPLELRLTHSLTHSSPPSYQYAVRPGQANHSRVSRTLYCSLLMRRTVLMTYEKTTSSPLSNRSIRLHM